MNMKQSGVSFSFSLRKLILNKDVKSIILKLNENKKNTGRVTIRLPLAYELFNRMSDHPDYDEDDFWKLCSKLDDSLFLDALFSLNVLSNEKCTEDGFSVGIKIKDQDFIKHLYDWVENKDLVLHYGIFDLHTFTGEAYCLDNKYVFHTGKGLYRVFRSFLEKPTHILDYQTIYEIFYEGEEVRTAGWGPEQIHQIINDIREKLAMKGELSRLFIPASKQYILKSGLAL